MSAKRNSKVDLTNRETEQVIKDHKEQLSQNLQHFMEIIPELNKRYTEFLEIVKRKNPKYRDSEAPKGTPLLKRQRTEEPAASQKETGEKEPPQAQAPPKGPGELPTLPDNNALLQELANVKHESYELTTMLNGVVDWISLSIPQIKDEDNLGVEVQERVLSEISGLSKVIHSGYESELAYLSGRAEHEAQYYKHFQAPSWRRVVEIHDLNEWDDLERTWRDMVRVTINAYSVLSKNMDKLKNPRKAQVSTLCM